MNRYILNKFTSISSAYCYTCSNPHSQHSTPSTQMTVITQNNS